MLEEFSKVDQQMIHEKYANLIEEWEGDWQGE
jgi:hypothetical protein